MSDLLATNNQSDKIYPAASDEVAKMLGLTGKTAAPSHPELPVAQPDAGEPKPSGFSQIVGNLYLKGQPQAGAASEPSLAAHDQPAASLSRVSSVTTTNRVVLVLKLLAPYILVFSVALLAYFYFFGRFNFQFSGNSTASQAKVLSAKDSVLAQLEQQDLANYNQWVSQFYYDVSDPKVLDPNADNSGNGLTNFQKFLLNLNPKAYDTLGLGMADSLALNQGINPLTGNALTEGQKAIISKYFDMEVILNRLTLAQMQKNGEVAGASVNSGAVVQTQSFPTQATVPQQADNLLAGDLEVDTTVPGRLDIPSLKISAPLIWSADAKNFETDLQNGVIHYPGTALPGQIGTTYISGHSSNYAWAKGDYNHVFTHLDSLADDASFSITVTQKGGKTVTLHYVVVGRQQYDPTDQAQFKNGGKSVVALSTCWPVG
ncbi:MAG: sortase, partial [Patescibacteria group bacterium]|nr:sortase [Patescibacteria group bacterium]